MKISLQSKKLAVYKVSVVKLGKMSNTGGITLESLVSQLVSDCRRVRTSQFTGNLQCPLFFRLHNLAQVTLVSDDDKVLAAHKLWWTCSKCFRV